MDAKLAVVRIKAAAAYVRLGAAASAQALQADVQAALLKAQAVSGQFVRFIILDDSAAVSDQTLLQLSKVFDELLAVSDDQTISFQKSLLDSASTQELVVASINKAISELVSSADVITGKELSKVLADAAVATDDLDGQATTQDEQTVAFFKARSESLGASDLASLVVLYVRQFEDFASSGDGLAISVSKALADQGVSLDAIAQAFSKQLADYAAHSDLLNLLAAKTLSESSAFTSEGPFISGPEDYSAEYFAEDYVGEGGPAKVIGKVLGDLALAADAAPIYAFDKSLLDIAVTAESRSMDISRATADSAQSSDEESMVVSKGVAESASALDASSTSTSKPLGHSAYVSDSTALQLQIVLSDFVATSDLASVALGQFAQQTATDSRAATDVAVSALTKVLADSAGKGDSGSLRMTDYCDISYFAEDFVGVSQTF